jgi:hypothetical protein
MQFQHNVHTIAPSFWSFAYEVRIEGRTLECRIRPGQHYDLVEAYSRAPHIEFLNCESPDQFKEFVTRWGPLLISDEQWANRRAIAQIDDYRNYRNLFLAISGLADACRGRKDRRESLVDYFRAEAGMLRAGHGREELQELSYLDRIDPSTANSAGKRDPIEWVRSASDAEVLRVLIGLFEDWVRPPNPWGLRVYPRRRRLEIKPCFELYSLWDGLRWMLWFDEWNRFPPTTCPECRKVFRPSSHHKQKFCSWPCAHRATNRKWRRKDLRSKKRRPRKGKSDGN